MAARTRGPRTATLDQDCTAIVQRFAGTIAPSARVLTPVRRRLRDTARRRARCLRAAIAALDATRTDEAVRTPNGSHTAGLGQLYRWHCADEAGQQSADVAVALLRLQADLRAVADRLDAIAHSYAKTPGRTSDPWAAIVVRNVAAACLRHGVRFTDNPHSVAATHLRSVFDALGIALSESGLRPYLRAAREAQHLQHPQR